MLKQLGYTVLFIALVITSCQEDPKGDADLLNGVLEDTTDLGFDTDMSDDIAAYKTVVNIIRETGLPQNFVILPGDVSNVKAYIEDNERILEYNPEFMEKLEGDTNWHGISVLARQIGHHLSSAELEEGQPNIEEEIRADKYAGYVLFKMGASLDAAIQAMEFVISEDSLGKGVSNNSRLASLTTGWNNAKSLASDTTLIAAVDTSQEMTVIASVNNDGSSDKPVYVYKVFLALDNTDYYVDEKDQVYQELDGEPKKVGVKKASNKPGFDWIFVKDEDSYGVDLKGRLWAFSTDGEFLVVGQSAKLSTK